MFGHLEKIRTLTPVSNLIEKLKLEAWLLAQKHEKCEAILGDILILLCTNSLSFGILYKKNLNSRAVKIHE